MVYCDRNSPRYSMDYLADLHQLIRRDNVPFWNEPRERRDGFVSFRCFLWLWGRGGEMTKPGLRGERGGWERALRGRKRTERTGTGFRERMKTRLSNRKKTGLWGGEKRESGIMWFYSGFFVKCKIGSQHSQHSQHFPPKPLRMRYLMGG